VGFFRSNGANHHKALWSRADDVTIFGGSGSHAKGWTAVKPRLEWAAARFRGGHGTLSKNSSTSLIRKRAELKRREGVGDMHDS
jgi:hypothetical protein